MMSPIKPIKTLLCGGLFLFLAFAPGGQTSGRTTEPNKPRVVETYGQLPMSFEINRGQTASQVKFLSRGPGYNLFLTPTETVLVLRKPEGNRSAMDHQPTGKPESARKINTSVVRMTLLDANPKSRLAGLEELPGRVNYFIGNDPKKWRTNVPTYAKVKYADVYPGIDLVYYGNGQQLEYDFVVAPGSDPSAIRLAFPEASNLEIDASGNLSIHAGESTARLNRPVVYQEVAGHKRQIDGSYVLDRGRTVVFRVAEYDSAKPLVIDPTLVYSTYAGGSGEDFGIGIAADAAGNAYVTGYTTSTNFPTTPGALQTTAPAPPTPPGGNAFVIKLNPTGTGAVYSTYLGGSVGNPPPYVGTVGYAVAVDAAGNAYITGLSQTADFPITPGAYQSSHPGGDCNPPPFGLMGGAFVTKLNSTGDAVIYSTFLGGNACTIADAIAVDSMGNAYVTGWYANGGINTTPGAFQRSGPGLNAFVLKLNPTGTGLVYSTSLNGTGGQAVGEGIAVDSAGNAYVTGATASSNFPTTPGVVQSVFRSTAMCHAVGPMEHLQTFVTKLNTTGTALVYSTLLGGTGCDGGSGIAVDSNGNAYVVGSTSSPDFPATPGALQTTFGGGGFDAFVAKLNPTGTELVYATYVGGSGWDKGGGLDMGPGSWRPGVSQGIAVDAAGNAYFTGCTNSTNFPTTPDAFQATSAGGASSYSYSGNGCFGGDAYVSVLNAAGSGMVYSTYLGGNGEERGNSIALDPSGYIYVAGSTSSTNFPTTPGAFQTIFGGGWNAFVAKIAGNRPPVANAGPDQMVSADAGCRATVTLNGTGSSDPEGDALTFTWTGLFGTASGPTPSATLPMGSHEITLTVDDGKGGTASDTVVVTVVDSTAPAISSVVASPSLLWPPNHRMVPVAVSVAAGDNCGLVTSAISLVTSNEPENGLGDGDTAPDMEITGPLTANLRAERSGTGSGRQYTITIQSTDGSGNSSTKATTVIVPHDQGKK